MAFKDATAAYKAQDYRVAAEKYEEAAANARRRLRADPTSTTRTSTSATATTICTGRPAAAKRPTTSCSTKAIDELQEVPPSVDDDPKIKRLALEYLVNAYGPDKLNDPSQAGAHPAADDRDGPERADQLLRAGQHLRAERRLRAAPRSILIKARESQAERRRRSTRSWPASTTARASSTRPWKRCTRAPPQEPNNPEAYYTIATYYWEKAYRDFTAAAGRQDQVRPGQGIEAVDKAIELKPRLLRGAHLQEPAPPRAGHAREGPGPAAAAAARGRPVPRPAPSKSATSSARPAPATKPASHRSGPVASSRGRSSPVTPAAPLVPHPQIVFPQADKSCAQLRAPAGLFPLE